MSLCGEAHAGVCGRCAAEGFGAGVPGELVVCVVAPGPRLVAAAGAVAYGVVAVLLLRQAQAFEVIVWCGLGEAAQFVVAVLGASQVAVDLGDVACQVVLVGFKCEQLAGVVGVVVAFDFDAGVALQGVVGQGLGGAGGGDLPGRVPLVVAVADLALVRQGDLRQAAFVVGVALLAAIGVGVAGQLAVGVEALAESEGDGPAARDLAVGDGALGGAALKVFGVAGAADELACAVLLFVAGKLAIVVVPAADALVQGAALQAVFFQGHAPCGVVAVGAGVGACIFSLGQLACCVVAVLNGSAQGSGFFDEAPCLVVVKAVSVAVGVGDSDELVLRVPALLGALVETVDGLYQAAQGVVAVLSGVACGVGDLKGLMFCTAIEHQNSPQPQNGQTNGEIKIPNPVAPSNMQGLRLKKPYPYRLQN